MGSSESSTRKVTFGVDDEDRVRILRGVKLTEDVLQRMRGVANQVPEPRPPAPPSPHKAPAFPPPPRSPVSQPRAHPQPQEHPQPCPQPCAQPCAQPCPPPTATNIKEDLRKSYEWQQSLVQEELSKVARMEREAARMEMTKALHKERLSRRQDGDQARLLALQLQKKDAELTALDAFYKEQLALLEKRNRDRYVEAGDQFHHAARKAETHVTSRCTEAVCTGLQAQVLSCYRGNREQTLLCSDLAKQYMQCINAAKKNLLVNHG